MLLGVDVGGTFTDAALADGDRIVTAKVPTTPSDQSQGVMSAIEAVLERAGAEPSDVTGFAHGMTVGTNALLERRGADTALVATAGFGDVIEVGRQARPHLYRLCEAPAEPLVPPGRRLGVAERIGPGDVVTELTDEAVETVVDAATNLGVGAIAVCLLFSYRDPSHEQRVAEALREALPGVHVSVSSEVLPRFREFERGSTTVVDAYLAPLLARYLEGVAHAAGDRGLPEPVVMKSSGGVAPVSEASRGGVWSVLSGPAGGAVGAGLLARLSGDGGALGFDMGGTSCDVCMVSEGRVRRTGHREIDGRVLALPMVDVHTVGAGGGSIGWVDGGGALRVGPASAGARPGPACYGHGGTEPTVTDANLLLGRLPGAGSLAGGVELDAEAARSVIAELAETLDLEIEEAAEGIVRIADQEMLQALRVVSVERGIDPREMALLPFGGAGGLHAAALAAELDMARILCPRAGGVLSALGLLASERRRDLARTVMLRGEELTAEAVAEAVAQMRDRLVEGLDDPEVEVGYALRYRGQAFELEIEASPEPEIETLAEAFGDAHHERFGYRDPDAELELVDIRIAATEPGHTPTPRAVDEDAGALERDERRVRLDGEWVDAAVLRGEPPAGTEANGPCVFELPETTLLLPAGWSASVDEHGTIVAERGVVSTRRDRGATPGGSPAGSPAA